MPQHDRVEYLIQVMQDGGEKAFDIVPKILARVIEGRLWTGRPDENGNPFQSFEAFVTHRLWQGLESTIDDLLAYCRKHPEVQRLIKAEVEPEPAKGGDRKSPEYQSSNTTLNIGRGSTYALKRLKRDAPELFRRVVDGDLSANAAAIQAGFRKRMLTIPYDVEAAADFLVRRLGVDGATALIGAISERLNRAA